MQENILGFGNQTQLLHLLLKRNGPLYKNYTLILYILHSAIHLIYMYTRRAFP